MLAVRFPRKPPERSLCRVMTIQGCVDSPAHAALGWLDGGNRTPALSWPVLLYLEGSSPKVHPAKDHHFPATWGCFPWGNPNKHPWRPKPGDGQYTQPRPVVLPNSQDNMAHTTTQTGCGSIPNLDMVSFPNCGCIPKLAQPCSGCTGSIAKAPQI